jgi:hypothetical protein
MYFIKLGWLQYEHEYRYTKLGTLSLEPCQQCTAKCRVICIIQFFVLVQNTCKNVIHDILCVYLEVLTAKKALHRVGNTPQSPEHLTLRQYY